MFTTIVNSTGIDFATRKIAGMLKPQKIFEQDGDSFTIKSLTTFRNYSSSFKIGEEFEEITKGLDNRKCQVENTHSRNRTISDLATKWCVVTVSSILLPNWEMTFLFDRLQSTGTMTDSCAFKKEKRRIEDGHTGWRETFFTWWDRFMTKKFKNMSILD